MDGLGQYIILFVLGFILDFLFAFYTKAVANANAFRGANFAGLLAICSMYSFGTAASSGNIFIACAFWAGGQWLGTYIGVKADNKEDK
jgi:hypothetical protein